MPTGLNPVQEVVRDHLARRYPAWRRNTEPIKTRGGPRYRGREVALLLREPLRDVGLFAYDDGYYYRGLLVTGQGKRVTREALAHLLRPALAEVGDAALVDTLGSESFGDALGEMMPAYDGPVTFTRARPKARTVGRDTLEAVREFLAEVLTEPLLAREVFEIYAEWADADFVPQLGRTTFYRIAEESGLVRRVRRSSGAFLLPVVRVLRRLSARAADALRQCGIADPEAYADEAEREVRNLAQALTPATLDPRVLALPSPVAFAVAGVPDPDVTRAFGLIAREHLRRHPEDRPAIAAVAVALRDGDPDGLVRQIRDRCVAALDAEQDAAASA